MFHTHCFSSYASTCSAYVIFLDLISIIVPSGETDCETPWYVVSFVLSLPNLELLVVGSLKDATTNRCFNCA